MCRHDGGRLTVGRGVPGDVRRDADDDRVGCVRRTRGDVVEFRWPVR